MASLTDPAITTTSNPVPSVTPTSTSALPIPFPQDTFPPPPRWFMGIVLSWIGIGFVLAIMLIMAQFPDLFPWMARMTGQQPPVRGFRKDLLGRERGVSSAVARHPNGEVEVDAGGFRQRKPRGLSVHTRDASDAGRKGLGIMMSCGNEKDEPQKKVKKQVSFDPSTGTYETPPCQSWQAATAPVPHTKSFLQNLKPADDDDSDDEIIRCPDIETGHPIPNARDLNDHYGDRRASPYFDKYGGDAADDEGGAETKGLLGKLNLGVYKVADKLSATFYDQVNGAEEGLLLPVRETEREGWMGRMVD